jgi:hypothetical protein
MSMTGQSPMQLRRLFTALFSGRTPIDQGEEGSGTGNPTSANSNGVESPNFGQPSKNGGTLVPSNLSWLQGVGPNGNGNGNGNGHVLIGRSPAVRSGTPSDSPNGPNPLGFTAADRTHLGATYGIMDPLHQLRLLIEGISPRKVIAPASIENGGIVVLTSEEERLAEDTYAAYVASGGRQERFVPAAGASSRLLKDVFRAEKLLTTIVRGGATPTYGNIESVLQDEPKLAKDLKRLVDGIAGVCIETGEPGPRFAFAEPLLVFAKNLENVQELSNDTPILPLVEALLEYLGPMPKGLVPCHAYPQGTPEGTMYRCALAEHFTAQQLAQGGLDASVETPADITFIVERGSTYAFREALRDMLQKYYAVNTKFVEQPPSANTIARDAQTGMIYRWPTTSEQHSGEVYAGPSGHGANRSLLQRIDNPMAYFHNSDNQGHARYQASAAKWQRILSGQLLRVRDQVFELLTRLDCDDCNLDEIARACEGVQIFLPKNFSTLGDPQKREMLRSKLDRPIRVAGMVTNTGQPGGGPYWLKAEDGAPFLQIVEAAELEEPEGTHFNPVDIASWLTDRHGKKFDLSRFANEDACIIVRKTHGHDEIDRLERPGLWNGAQEHFITVCVHMPDILESEGDKQAAKPQFFGFKGLRDLLEETHQPSGGSVTFQPSPPRPESIVRPF